MEEIENIQLEKEGKEVLKQKNNLEQR